MRKKAESNGGVLRLRNTCRGEINSRQCSRENAAKSGALITAEGNELKPFRLPLRFDLYKRMEFATDSSARFVVAISQNSILRPITRGEMENLFLFDPEMRSRRTFPPRIRATRFLLMTTRCGELAFSRAAYI